MTDVYDTYPPLSELLEHGGTPGIEYAYVLGQNIVKAQQDKWETLHRLSAFSVAGRNGAIALVVMGRGEPISGASPHGMVCKLSIDEEADDLLGLHEATEDSLDKTGASFDADVHDTEEDGTPILNNDGTLRRRRRPLSTPARAPAG